MNQQLSSFSSLGVQYIARSGMEESVSSGILRGRPFGGVSIAWSPNLNNSIKPLANFRHKRVVGIEAVSVEINYLLICTYMPFYDASKKDECMAEAIDAITMIENIINAHPEHCVILGCDLNTELRGNSPFDQMWNEVLNKYDLQCCDHLTPGNINYTYFHDSLGQRK